MGTNKSLQDAKARKDDEFYTQYEDIEKELSRYINHFKDKVVFCNCDDPKWSNFWRFFHCNFEWLGLKKIISTHYNYDGSPSYALTYEGGYDLDVEVGTEIPLKENGDFRSDECIEFLKEADIVVTNPPFSMFREYICQLLDYNKSFVVIGPTSALHYSDTFPYLADNRIWTGYKSVSDDMLFNVTEEHAEWLMNNKKKGSGYKIINGEVKGRSQAIWYTNLDIEKRHEPFFKEESKKYYYYDDPSQYPKYENVDAIDVNAVSIIPIDYFGMMGVPDSFIDMYNPDEFELIAVGSGNLAKLAGVTKNYRGRTDVAYKDKNGNDKCPYSRILIRRKGG